MISRYHSERVFFMCVRAQAYINPIKKHKHIKINWYEQKSFFWLLIWTEVYDAFIYFSKWKLLNLVSTLQINKAENKILTFIQMHQLQIFSTGKWTFLSINFFWDETILLLVLYQTMCNQFFQTFLKPFCCCSTIIFSQTSKWNSKISSSTACTSRDNSNPVPIS